MFTLQRIVENKKLISCQVLLFSKPARKIGSFHKCHKIKFNTLRQFFIFGTWNSWESWKCSCMRLPHADNRILVVQSPLWRTFPSQGLPRRYLYEIPFRKFIPNLSCGLVHRTFEGGMTWRQFCLQTIRITTNTFDTCY